MLRHPRHRLEERSVPCHAAADDAQRLRTAGGV